MASGIRNPNAIYGYVGESDDWKPVEPCDEHPEGLPRSVWTFHREQTSDDRDLVGEMTTRTIMGRVDRAHVRKLMKTNGDVAAYLADLTTTDILMSTEKAMLGVMGAKVEGPFFTIPKTYTLDDGVTPHPLAGQLIPQPPPRRLATENKDEYKAQLLAHVEWLGLLDPNERSDALEFMTAVWAGRDPSAAKEFQPGGERVDEPTASDGQGS